MRESVVIAVLGTGSFGRGNSRYHSEPFIFLGSCTTCGCPARPRRFVRVGINVKSEPASPVISYLSLYHYTGCALGWWWVAQRLRAARALSTSRELNSSKNGGFARRAYTSFLSSALGLSRSFPDLIRGVCAHSRSLWSLPLGLALLDETRDLATQEHLVPPGRVASFV